MVKQSSGSSGAKFPVISMGILTSIVTLVFYFIFLHMSTPSPFPIELLPAPHHRRQLHPLRRLKNYLSHSSSTKLTDEHLKEWVDFKANTLLNFMHFHKTGGNAIKSAFHRLYHNVTFNSTGQRAIIHDSCYRRIVVHSVSMSNNSTTATKQVEKWRCDWNRVDPSLADSVILTFGHQYLPQLYSLFPTKHIRSFTVLRHPFDRKISFFFHFLVRARRLSENDVELSALHDFLLSEEGSKECDSGPNYYAGRLLSFGPTTDDFVLSRDRQRKLFLVGKDRRQHASVVKLAKDELDRMVFVGLQSQPDANQCMLNKVMLLFNEAVGVSQPTALLSSDLKQAQGYGHGHGHGLNISKINSGSYRLNSSYIWKSMSKRQQRAFAIHEDIDLKIYRYAKTLFYQHVRLFRCEEHLKK